MQAPPFTAITTTTTTTGKPSTLPIYTITNDMPRSASRTRSTTATNTSSTATLRAASPKRMLIADRLHERRLVQNTCLSLLLFIVLLLPGIICEFYMEPHQRGFFCDDETIRYPFHASTITNGMLTMIVCALPLITIMFIEMLLHYRHGEWCSNYTFYGCKIRKWLSSCIKQYSYFIYGLLLVFNATEMGKFTIARLRPHFLSVCQPMLSDGSTCADPQNQNRFILDYVCLGEGFSLADIRQARFSFPSGHASVGVYAMLYLVLYTQMRLSARRSKLAKNTLQFLFLLIAWFTALSRVMDNWHHWSDVVIGMLMGVLGAILTAKYVSCIMSKRFWPVSYKLPLPRTDTTGTLQDVV